MYRGAVYRAPLWRAQFPRRPVEIYVGTEDAVARQTRLLSPFFIAACRDACREPRYLRLYGPGLSWGLGLGWSRTEMRWVVTTERSAFCSLLARRCPYARRCIELYCCSSPGCAARVRRIMRACEVACCTFGLFAFVFLAMLVFALR